ncbi:hypothetical protein KXR87_15045 [Yokenella regensburgei]|uniref:hypothetical protein n=1 Tax=Yokenella regensburgei TaxID=158877 RepID=UPI003F18FB37
MVIQNKFGSLGLFLGVIALLMGLIHSSMGPFSSPVPTVEKVIAEKITAVKKGIVAGLKGEEPQTYTVVNKPADIDKIVDNTGLVMAVMALLCAFIAGIRKENRWGIYGALCFGGGTLAFHALLFGIGVVFTILLILAIIAFFTGTSPF